MKRTLNATERLTLHLLDCALWGGEPRTDLFDLEQTDWQGIVDLAVRHTVHGLVASQMKRVAETLGDEGLAMGCLQILMQTGRASSLLDEGVARVARALEAGGFGGALLKGQGVARYYREPGLRVCGDIDYYTGARTTEAAQWLVANVEGTTLHRTGNEQKHTGCMLGDVEIELHWRAANSDGTEAGERLLQWTESTLASGDHRTATIGGAEVRVPTAMFDAIYVFHHFFHHFLHEGIALRQVCDWLRCLYVNRDEIDRGELERLLKDFGLLGAWRLFGAMAVRHLGMPSDAFPLYNNKVCARKSDRLLRLLLDSSNFGQTQKTAFESALQSDHWWKHKWQSMSHYTRFYASRAWLFPRQGGHLLLKYYKMGIKGIKRNERA